MAISNSRFLHNQAGYKGFPAGQGGALYVGGGTVTITNSSLENNEAGVVKFAFGAKFAFGSQFQGAGGALYVGGGTVTITNSRLLNNAGGAGHGGGAICASGSTVKVVRSVLEGNSAGGNGARAFASHSTPQHSVAHHNR